MVVQNDWLSTKTAAEELGVTLRTLYRLIDGGELIAYKIGRVIRLRRNDLDAYIDSTRLKPGELKHLYPTSGSREGDSE